MHSVDQLQKNLDNPVFFDNQFVLEGQKNILFVEPQLSAKHMYKSIFPFFNLFNGKRGRDGSLEEIYTSVAVTGIDKYNPEEQLFSVHTILKEEWIKWAHVIMFPFTCANLLDEYEKIKKINPDCKIAYHVDFNYYELKNHPYGAVEKFTSDIEMNILASDFCFTANKLLQDCLIKTLEERVKEKKMIAKTQFCNVPVFIDTVLCNQNVEEDSPMIRIVKDAARDVEKVKSKKKEKKSKKKEVTIATEHQLSQPFREPITVGIIYSKTYREYYKAFNNALKQLTDNVSLVIIGYDPKEDRDDVFKGITYDYVKPCSIIHFFKQLYNIKLDLCLIPGAPDNFLVTSETGNRYLECGIFGIPVLAPNQFPYSPLIRDDVNGFLYKDPQDAIEKIKHLSTTMPWVRNAVGPAAKNDILAKYTWSKENINYYMSCLNS